VKPQQEDMPLLLLPPALSQNDSRLNLQEDMHANFVNVRKHSDILHNK